MTNSSDKLFGVCSALSLSVFLVFCCHAHSSGPAHYLKPGKDWVIFSIHAQSLTGCLLRWWWSGGMGENRASRPEKEKQKEGGTWSWGLEDGGWDHGDIQMRRQEEKQAFPHMLVSESRERTAPVKTKKLCCHVSIKDSARLCSINTEP